MSWCVVPIIHPWYNPTLPLLFLGFGSFVGQLGEELY